MCGHDRAAGHALGPHLDLRAEVSAADHPACGTRLYLIGEQVQTRLDQRMIEQAVFFATGHKREAGHIGKHSSRAILPIEPEQGTRLRELVCFEVTLD